MKISKLHLLRIMLSSLFTILFFKVTTVMVALNQYLLARLMLDAQQYDIAFKVGIGELLFIYAWFYTFYFIAVFLLWRYFGLPNTIGIVAKINSMRDYFSEWIPDDDEDEG